MIYSEILGECMEADDSTLYLQRMRIEILPSHGVERSLTLA